MHRSILTVVTILILAGPAHSEGVKQCFRCKSDGGLEKICQGASTSEVIQKCGEPDSSEKTEKVSDGTNYKHNGNRSSGQIETYYYNCGAGRFIKKLKFDDGILYSIINSDKSHVGRERCW